MSATRYSGDLKIRVTLVSYVAPSNPLWTKTQEQHHYRCFIRCMLDPSTAPQTVIVQAPANGEYAPNSPEAFTLAAQYAIAYAHQSLQAKALANAEHWAAFVSLKAQAKAIAEGARTAALSPTERETERVAGQNLDKFIQPMHKTLYKDAE